MVSIKSAYGTVPRNNTIKQACVLVTEDNVIEDISGSINVGSASVISSINQSNVNVSLIGKSNLSNIIEIENINDTSKTLNESNLLKPEIPKIVNKNFPKLVSDQNILCTIEYYRKIPHDFVDF